MGCANSNPRGNRLQGVWRIGGFDREYAMGARIGMGAFSYVHEATRVSDGAMVAVKCVSANLAAEDRAALEREVAILAELRHEHIVAFHEGFKERDSYYIVTELACGGELFAKIAEKGTFTEEEARDVVRAIAGALEHCHARGVVHRDMKPENVLLSQRGAGGVVKVSDFGMAAILRAGVDLSTSCGSPHYSAPEVLGARPQYGAPADVWGLGVITHILLCGEMPFVADSEPLLRRKIRREDPDFAAPQWGQVSAPAKDLVRAMLQRDPSRRLTCTAVLHHPFLRHRDTHSVHPLPAAVAGIRRFNARRRLMGGLHAVRATVRLGLLATPPGSPNRASAAPSNGKSLQQRVEQEAVTKAEQAARAAPCESPEPPALQLPHVGRGAAAEAETQL